MGAITEIFRTFGPEYLARYPDMPIQHKKTVAAIINCRSGQYGVAVYRCDNCGKEHHIDRSCGNRLSRLAWAMVSKCQSFLRTCLKKNLTPE